MKKFILFALLLHFSVSGFAQPGSPADTVKAPYLLHPTYPPVKLLQLDSTTWFTKENLKKNMPVMIVFFDPGCEHCKHETEELVKNMDKMKDIQIVMASYKPLYEIKPFVAHYGLDKFPNIVVAQDQNFFLPSFYKISFFPYMAFYNKKKELITVFQGQLPIEEVIENSHK